MPAAMAPDDTITTSEPAFIRASMASASVASLPASNTPDGVVSAVVPTLTTTLRAVADGLPVRAHGSLLPALLDGARLRSSAPHPVGLFQPGVGAPAGQRHVDACRRLRLPVEGHVADRDRTAGSSAQPQQLVLDAEPGQPVAEVADGLVVVEIGLRDPAFGPHAVHHEAALAVRLDGESAVVNRVSDGSPGAAARSRAAPPGSADTKSHSANVNGRNPSRLTVETSNTGQP